MKQDGRIGLILIDDHRRVHQAIAEMLDFIDDIDLLAQGHNGLDAIALCDEHQPDVVLMDVVMPGMDGIEATRQITSKHPDIKILALSSFKDPDTTRAMLEAGAAGFILKDSSVDDLENTIRTAFEGQSILSPEVMQSLLVSPQSGVSQAVSLTPREQEVLQHFAAGMTNGEIAAQLSISVSTVKFHISNILEKLGVQTRAEALVIAAKHNLV